MTENAHPQIWDICIAQFPLLGKKTYARRPVVVVGAEAIHGRVTVVPLSARLDVPQLATHIYLEDDCLARPSRTLCEFVSTIPVSDLLRHIGRVDIPFTRYAIRHALAVHLDLPELSLW